MIGALVFTAAIILGGPPSTGDCGIVFGGTSGCVMTGMVDEGGGWVCEVWKCWTCDMRYCVTMTARGTCYQEIFSDGFESGSVERWVGP